MFEDYDEDRTVAEQFQALGVLGNQVKTVTNVTWATRYKRQRKKRYDSHITVAKGSIGFGSKVIKWLKSGRVVIGFGEYDGQKVILLKPSDDDDSRAFKIGIDRRRISTDSLQSEIKFHKPPIGRYAVSKIKGCFMAVPEKVRPYE